MKTLEKQSLFWDKKRKGDEKEGGRKRNGDVVE